MDYIAHNRAMLEFSCNEQQEYTIACCFFNNDDITLVSLLKQYSKDDLAELLSGDFGSCLLLCVYETGSKQLIDTFDELGYNMSQKAWDCYDVDSRGPFANTTYSSIAMMTFGKERLTTLLEGGYLQPLNDKAHTSWAMRQPPTILALGLCYNNDDVFKYFQKWYVDQVIASPQEVASFPILKDMMGELSCTHREEMLTENIKQQIVDRVHNLMSTLHQALSSSQSPFPASFLHQAVNGDLPLTQMLWTQHLSGKDQDFIDMVGRTLIAQEHMQDFSCVVPFMSVETLLDCMDDYSFALEKWYQNPPRALKHMAYVSGKEWELCLPVLGQRFHQEGFHEFAQKLDDFAQLNVVGMLSGGKDDDRKIMEQMVLTLKLSPQSTQKLTYKKKM